MKLCVKKVYCSRCKQLVRCHEEKGKDNTHVLCPRCKKPLYIRTNNTWKLAG